MTVSRIRSKFLALAVASTLVAGWASSAPAVGGAKEEPCETTTKYRAGDGGRWTSFTPVFPVGEVAVFSNEADIRAFAVTGSGNRRTVFIANDRVVLRSDTGSCDWETVFELSATVPNGPRSAHTLEIRDIVATGTHDEQHVFLALSGKDGLGSQLTLLRSTDLGDTWTETSGLPPVGAHPSLRSAPSDPSLLYFSIQLGPYAAAPGVGSPTHRTLFYVSKDGGESWESRSDVSNAGLAPGGSAYASGFDFLVEPEDPEHLWAWDGELVVHSTDGAATWTEVAGDGAPQGAADLEVISRHRARPTVVVAPSCDEGATCHRHLAVSKDGGNTWGEMDGPDDEGFILELAHSDATGGLLASATKPWRYIPKNEKWVEVTRCDALCLLYPLGIPTIATWLSSGDSYAVLFEHPILREDAAPPTGLSVDIYTPPKKYKCLSCRLEDLIGGA